MLTKLAKNIAHSFSLNNAIKSEDEEVYAYGMEILLSTIANGLAVLIISLFTNTLLSSLIFWAVFIVMRRSAGGYHAKTHAGCLAILVFVHTAFTMLIDHISEGVIMPLSIIAIAFSAVAVISFAPIEHPNKPIDELDRKRLRKKSVTLIIIIPLLVSVLMHFKMNSAALYISCGILVSAVAMIAEVIHIKRNEKVEKEEQ